MEFVDEYRVAIYWFSDGSAIVRPYFGDDWNLFKDWYDGTRSAWSCGWGRRDDNDVLGHEVNWVLEGRTYWESKAGGIPAWRMRMEAGLTCGGLQAGGALSGVHDVCRGRYEGGE